LPENATTNTANYPPPLTNQDIKSCKLTPQDNNLEMIVALWDKLPANIQSAIISIVQPYKSDSNKTNQDKQD
jgi:hypothetical protein